MDRRSNIRRRKRLSVAAIGIAAATFALGLYLIWRYPVVYWNDAYTRLAYRDQVLVGRWLPAMQMLVFLTGKLPAGLVVLRVLLAGIAAGAVLAIYRYTAGVFDPPTGLLAAALLGTHTLFIALTTVPYREVLIAALCFLVLPLLDRASEPRRRATAYSLVVLLNLTRYDAWLFVPIFVLLEACRGYETGGWKAAIHTGMPAALIMGAVPVGWTLFGPIVVLEHETGVLERILNGEVRVVLAGMLDHDWWRTRWDLLVFGAAGAAAALADPNKRRHPLRLLSLAGIQFTFLTVAGIWRAENLRMTFLPTVLLIPYAARVYLLAAGRLLAGIRQIFPALERSRLPEGSLLAAAAAGFALLVYAGFEFVAGASGTPVYRAGYAAGSAFSDRDFTGVLILADAPVGPYVFASYSDVPLEAIYEIGPTTLDHTLPDWSAAGLAAAGVSHVVGIYANAGELSLEELKLLDMLGSGEVPSAVVSKDGPRIWRLFAEGEP